MTITATCSTCKTHYTFARSKIPDGVGFTKCNKCGNVIPLPVNTPITPPPLPKKCPKCGYLYQPQDDSVSERECPRCGVIYEKYETFLQQKQYTNTLKKGNRGKNKRAGFIKRPLLYSVVVFVCIILCTSVVVFLWTTLVEWQAPVEQKTKFEIRFGFAPPEDVTDLEYYDDIWIDVTYQMTFKASRATINRIVNDCAFEQKSLDNISIAYHFAHEELAGWDSCPLDSPPYWKQNSRGDFFEFLWYDGTSRACYLAYSF